MTSSWTEVQSEDSEPNLMSAWVKGRHVQCTRSCQLWANSGHLLAHWLRPKADMCVALADVR